MAKRAPSKVETKSEAKRSHRLVVIAPLSFHRLLKMNAARDGVTLGAYVMRAVDFYERHKPAR